MSRNDIFYLGVGGIFFIIFIYFCFIKNYLIASGWLILTISALLYVYTPKETGYREIEIIINVVLPFIALIIFIYSIFFT